MFFLHPLFGGFLFRGFFLVRGFQLLCWSARFSLERGCRLFVYMPPEFMGHWCLL